MRWRWLAPLLCMPAACGGVEVGPSYDDAWAVARPYCSEPLVSLPATIDSDVRTIRFSGRREAEVVAYLFSNPGYSSVELGPSRLLPDGLGLVRYTIAGSSRMVNHRHTCPDGAADLGLHPSVPRASNGPRACVTVKAGASPIARWAIHRTIDESTKGSFRRRVTTDEVIDTRDGKVVAHAREVHVDTDRVTTGAAVIGFFPIVGANYRVKAGCGRTLAAADIMQLLVPPAKKAPR